MPTNPYPWPSINNVSQTLDSRIRHFLTSCDNAADLIATWFRRYKDLKSGSATPSTETETGAEVEPVKTWSVVRRRWKGMLQARHVQNSRIFHDYFHAPCVATQKFDGTNVGVTECGLILGRRHTVDTDLPKYQGTALTHVKVALAKVKLVKRDIFSLLPSDAEYENLHCTLYGELMCNGSRFDYSERKLGSKFACFGVILRGTQTPEEDVAERTTEALRGANLLVSTSKEPIYVEGEEEGAPSTFRIQLKLMMCSTLRTVLEKHNLECVAPAADASITEVVRTTAPWMLEGGGEGVVLTVGGLTGGLVKWKTATENQGGTPDLLRRLGELLTKKGQSKGPVGESGEGGGKAEASTTQIVEPAIVAMIETMHAVSVSDCGGRSAKAVAARKEKKKAKGGQPSGPPPVNVADLEAAYDSALTKYDTLHALFDQGGNVRTVSQTLYDEVAEDLGLVRDAKAAGAQPGGVTCDFAIGRVKSANKCGCKACSDNLLAQAFVKRFVMKNVGSAFGSWKTNKSGGF